MKLDTEYLQINTIKKNDVVLSTLDKQGNKVFIQEKKPCNIQYSEGDKWLHVDETGLYVLETLHKPIPYPTMIQAVPNSNFIFKNILEMVKDKLDNKLSNQHTVNYQLYRKLRQTGYTTALCKLARYISSHYDFDRVFVVTNSYRQSEDLIRNLSNGWKRKEDYSSSFYTITDIKGLKGLIEGQDKVAILYDSTVKHEDELMVTQGVPHSLVVRRVNPRLF